MIPYNSAELARRGVPRLLRCFDAAVAARAKGGTVGARVRAKARWDEAVAIMRATKHPDRYDTGALQEAARVLAILYRRRAVDEQPKGGKPLPKIEHQLAAMLPASAAPLIREAIRLSAKQSGEDPIWIRGHGVELERGRVPRWRDRDPGGIGL